MGNSIPFRDSPHRARRGAGSRSPLICKVGACVSVSESHVRRAQRTMNSVSAGLALGCREQGELIQEGVKGAGACRGFQRGNPLLWLLPFCSVPAHWGQLPGEWRFVFPDPRNP